MLHQHEQKLVQIWELNFALFRGKAQKKYFRLTSLETKRGAIFFVQMNSTKVLRETQIEYSNLIVWVLTTALQFYAWGQLSFSESSEKWQLPTGQVYFLGATFKSCFFSREIDRKESWTQLCKNLLRSTDPFLGKIGLMEVLTVLVF